MYIYDNNNNLLSQNEVDLTSVTYDNQNLLVGTDSPTSTNFYGYIDELKIYNYATQ